MRHKSKKLHKNRKFCLIAVGVILISLIICSFLIYKRDSNNKKPSITASKVNLYKQPDKAAKPTDNKKAIDTTPVPKPATSTWPVILTQQQAASTTVVVNKKHKLPANYIPQSLTSVYGSQLSTQAASAANQLILDASKLGFSLKVVSGYRSYQNQEATYNGYVSKDGQALADTYSARPGFSEHQTGLAADIGYTSGNCALKICFGDTEAGKWLAANAANYGFIIRYPSGKEAITGYQYEPWHLRYLGIDTAKAVAASGKTLDEYYNIPAGGYQ